MGIGSLANATLQITTRDDYIGWSLKALTKRIKDDSTSWPEIRNAMLSTLASERRLLRQDDLRRHEIDFSTGDLDQVRITVCPAG